MSKLATEEDNVAIGRRLAAVRDRARLVQTEFAERLGLSPRAYQNYERGEREVPAVVLKALYEVYGADPLWVLTGLTMETESPHHLDVLEAVIVAVESRLKASRRSLPSAKKARLVKLMYLYFRDKPRVDPAHVAEMLALAAQGTSWPERPTTPRWSGGR